MNTPQLHSDLLPAIDTETLAMKPLSHSPRILLLYGSNRDVSYSRLAVLEAERILRFLGADTQIFHPKVQELHQMLAWAEGMVWCSPERHGAMSSILKAQIDWIPLAAGAIRATQGKALALMQVCGGSQSFNSVNQMRILGRWMRMLTIPNQSSVPKAFTEFDENGRMKPSAYYDRIVDVMEELVKFTLLTRGQSAYLTDRYSERKESAAELSKRVNQGNL